jgi:aspartate/tyrosine/aromatic aminotransferase
VRKAEHRIFEAEMNHEYAPIVGEAQFSKLSANLAFGEGTFLGSSFFCSMK